MRSTNLSLIIIFHAARTEISRKARKRIKGKRNIYMYIISERSYLDSTEKKLTMTDVLYGINELYNETVHVRSQTQLSFWSSF